MTATEADIPPQVYIGSEQVMGFLADHGHERLRRLTAMRVLALGVLAGAFITTGAFLSVLLSTGVASEGPARLLQGLGFSAGFFFVILSGAVLFTEANVVLPAVVLGRRDRWRSVLRFWALAWVGNLVGATVTGQLIALASHPSQDTIDLLSQVVAGKTATTGEGLGAWMALVVSGFLANWLVGMAAFFATMGRTLFGKYIPVFLAVTAFVSAGFQHSPANMGFFSLDEAFVGSADLVELLAWNLVPAGLGNIAGGALAVTALLSWAHAARPVRTLS
ncbi:MAG: formate/nitrite transporter family protein [Intrasporangiaceae bacterium]|nr:formate/nitrite transporter family protein [Intrasporangiaceae bacterium]